MKILATSGGFLPTDLGAFQWQRGPLIEHAIRYSEEHVVPRERFEFQMLYGVRPQLQLDLVRRGYKVLVATPYGPEWYPYIMRRLGERPANLLFFAKNTFRR